jgi:predicted nucleic acid-binding protein
MRQEMPEIAVVDTSVLIALEKINLLDILCRLYERIIVPEAVVNEFGTLNIDCHLVMKVKRPLVKLLVSDLNLGKGESEAIAVARETGTRIIIDDLKARKIAETLELNVTGTIGLLLKAENMALIESAYDKVKKLRDKGFYVSDQVMDSISKFKTSG